MTRDNAEIADDDTVVLQTPYGQIVGVMSGQLYRETVEDLAGVQEAWRKLTAEFLAAIEGQILS